MRFRLVDRILDFRPGEGIRAAKSVSLAEEYLADHFPGYPVLPGVLMLEALAQSAAWYLRLVDDFKDSMILPAEASHVRYGKFVTPGETLLLDLAFVDRNSEIARFRGKGTVLVNGSEVVAVQARLSMRSYSLVDRDPKLARTDEHLRLGLRRALSELRPALPAASEATSQA